jgi:PadR family transcriptional regulator PadR
VNAETLKGHLDLLLLAAVQSRPSHGYAIAETLRARSNGTFDLPEGTLYPALHRLEERGLVAAQWGASEHNRRAKYYELTRQGRARLQVEIASWTRYTAAISAALVAPSLR